MMPIYAVKGENVHLSNDCLYSESIKTSPMDTTVRLIHGVATFSIVKPRSQYFPIVYD